MDWLRYSNYNTNTNITPARSLRERGFKVFLQTRDVTADTFPVGGMYVADAVIRHA